MKHKTGLEKPLTCQTKFPNDSVCQRTTKDVGLELRRSFYRFWSVWFDLKWRLVWMWSLCVDRIVVNGITEMDSGTWKWSTFGADALGMSLRQKRNFGFVTWTFTGLCRVKISSSPKHRGSQLIFRKLTNLNKIFIGNFLSKIVHQSTLLTASTPVADR